jgi:hypothetical protein
MLRWLKTFVVSDEEKAPMTASDRDQDDERERIADDVSIWKQGASKPGLLLGSGMSLAGAPISGQAVSGMEAR